MLLEQPPRSRPRRHLLLLRRSFLRCCRGCGAEWTGRARRAPPRRLASLARFGSQESAERPLLRPGPGGAENHLRRTGRGLGGCGLRSRRAVEGEGGPPFWRGEGGSEAPPRPPLRSSWARGGRRRGPGCERGGCLGEGARGDSAPGEAEAAGGGEGEGQASPRLGAQGGTSPRPECEAEARRPRGLEARPAGPPQPWRTRTQRRWRRCWATSASTRARGWAWSRSRSSRRDGAPTVGAWCTGCRGPAPLGAGPRARKDGWPGSTSWVSAPRPPRAADGGLSPRPGPLGERGCRRGTGVGSAPPRGSSPWPSPHAASSAVSHPQQLAPVERGMSLLQLGWALRDIFLSPVGFMRRCYSWECLWLFLYYPELHIWQKWWQSWNDSLYQERC